MGAGLYIHIPFCRRKCLYCDFASWEGRLHDAERYVRALLAEMERYPERPRADTIYVGGGTPSLLPPGLLARILERARLRFRVEEDAEITLEANPGTVSMASLREYRAMGINRLSLGMQAAQDALLARLGRIHTVADFLRAAREAREAGFDNLSADIMSGLPGQRARDLAASIRTAAEAGCAHISLYTLKIEPGTPFAHRMALGELPLPGEDEEYDMTMLARDTLAELGYRRYEISNYARPGRACRHNLNYWDNGFYIGLGCAAASHRESVRYKNTEDIDAYMEAMERGCPAYDEWLPLTPQEEAADTVMLSLRTTAGLDLARYRERHGMDFGERFGARAETLVGWELAKLTPERFSLTDRGLDLQNRALLVLLEDP